jgi:hypothetical protein
MPDKATNNTKHNKKTKREVNKKRRITIQKKTHTKEDTKE